MTRSAGKIGEVKIDPTALVHPSAELDTGVEIGPYTTIGRDVRIGKNTTIGSHAVIDKWVTIGTGCRVFQFTSIGAPPQDTGYKGERTETIIGDNNIVREFVTIHRSTIKQDLKTVIGNENLFMNYVHVAHDCTIGDHVIMANASTLGGHVVIEDHSIVGGLVAIHQYVRIGAYSLIAGCSAVSKDIPPYVLAEGNRAHLYGLNKVGLRRKGFSKTDMEEVKKAYHILFTSSLKLRDAVERLEAELPGSIHARRYIEFINASSRGMVRVKAKRKGA